MPLRINSIKSKSGQSVQLNMINVLVGSNNVGKSQVLKDMRDYLRTGILNHMKVLEHIDIRLPTEVEAFEKVQVLSNIHAPGHFRYLGVGPDLKSRCESGVPESWHQIFGRGTDPNRTSEILRVLGNFLVAYLDAEGRFSLASPSEAYDTREESPSNALQQFFAADLRVRESLRVAFKEAFQMDIALDWAAMKRFYLKVGTNFGVISNDQKELDALLKDADQLSEQGDGYKSFAGVALSLLSFSDRVLLLDEPEAFLHPAQAKILGRWVARQAVENDIQLVIASHSSDFLSGVLSAFPRANVIRINRVLNDTRLHVIPVESAKELVSSPLLSSQPVVDALFHKGVVICEGDPDRAIYQAVAQHASNINPGSELLFIHSNGKDAAKIPLKLMRDSDIPAAVIVDIDVINSLTVLEDLYGATAGTPMPQDLIDLQKSIMTYVSELPEDKLLNDLKASIADWVALPHSDLRSARRGLSLHPDL